MDKTHRIVMYIENALQVLWGLLFLLLPLFFLTFTTDLFILPKQIIITLVVLLSLILMAVQAVVTKKVSLRQTSLDLPVAIFMVVIFLSSLFAVNRYDSLITAIIYLTLGISFFILVNTIKKESTAFFFLSILVLGTALASLVSIFSYFKVYIFNLPFTKTPYFSTLGSTYDTLIYFVIILSLSIYFALPIIKGKMTGRNIFFAISSILIFGGVLVSGYQLVTTQKPIILPYLTGFQISMAAISQDASRVAQGFFFGSGIGTFATDFTRFKPYVFNLNADLWYITFTNSSSYIWELLATTGILGILAYIFIVFRAVIKPSKTNPMFIPVCLLFLGSILIPYSYIQVVLLLLLLSLFAAIEGLKSPSKGVDLEFALVSLRKSLFFGQTQSHARSANTSPVLPYIFSVILLAIAGFIGWYAIQYVASDMLFTQSLNAANNNNGAITYQKQVQAINTFPYKDNYYRTFSQTNLAIANSLISLQVGKNQKPSQQIQDTILNLIQQGITVGRTATTLAPQTVTNWQNLSTIYRSLIGLGQGADNFAIAMMQQAVALDPANPQEYINLGGIYYQLGRYDEAIRAFQVAVNLKPDYPNAYYNLGHAYEQKGDLQNALTAYQNVKTLVYNNKDNVAKITADITAVQTKIGNQAPTPQTSPTPKPQATLKPVQNSEPLNLAQPSTITTPQPTQTQLPLQ